MGFYNYKARLYDPEIGRFITPDRLYPKPETPQLLNRYSYANNNPLCALDPAGLWTISIAISIDVSLGPVTFSFNGGIAIDDLGNVAIAFSYGGGQSVGAKASGGLNAGYSNAKTVGDLAGPFNNVTVSAGKGVGASITTFTGDSPNGNVVGTSVTIGPGVGVGVSNTITQTAVTPLGNIKGAPDKDDEGKAPSKPAPDPGTPNRGSDENSSSQSPDSTSSNEDGADAPDGGGIM